MCESPLTFSLPHTTDTVTNSDSTSKGFFDSSCPVPCPRHFSCGLRTGLSHSVPSLETGQRHFPNRILMPRPLPALPEFPGAHGIRQRKPYSSLQLFLPRKLFTSPQILPRGQPRFPNYAGTSLLRSPGQPAQISPGSAVSCVPSRVPAPQHGELLSLLPPTHHRTAPCLPSPISLRPGRAATRIPRALHRAGQGSHPMKLC